MSDTEKIVIITPREKEVLEYIQQGRSSPGIADVLGIGTGTVKTHLEHLFLKFGVQNRTQLALKAIQNGHKVGKQKRGGAP